VLVSRNTAQRNTCRNRLRNELNNLTFGKKVSFFSKLFYFIKCLLNFIDKLCYNRSHAVFFEGMVIMLNEDLRNEDLRNEALRNEELDEELYMGEEPLVR